MTQRLSRFNGLSGLFGLPSLARAARSLHMLCTVLARNRLRSVLATLGVFLGALLLTLILHVLESVNIMLEAEARRLGSHVATLTTTPVDFVRNSSVLAEQPAATDTGLSETARSAEEPTEEERLLESLGLEDDEAWRTQQAPKSAALTVEDIRALEKLLPQIDTAAPFVLVSGQAANGILLGNCQLLGTTADFPALRHFFPARGRFFTNEELEARARVCLLGAGLARRFFGAEKKALGRTVTVDKCTLTVIGVMEEKGMDPSGLRLDEVLILPVTTYCQRLAKQDHVSGAWLGLASRDNLARLEEDILAILGARHHLPPGRQDCTLAFAEQVDEMVTNALKLIRTLGLIGSGLSFAIGTLGILSIMTLLVRSRRLEIGMRRVVGATRKKILLQFIAEAAFLSTAGGLSGVATALFLCALIALFGLLPGYFSASITLGVLILSILCGILAGAYPAWKAAHTDVLQTLRDL